MRQHHPVNLPAFQARLRAVRSWFERKTWVLIFCGAGMALFTLVGIPSFSRAIRLSNLGKRTDIIVSSSRTEVVGGGNTGALVTYLTHIEGQGREFRSDKEYKRGDHAFLIYLDRFDYGLITEKPNSLFEILLADGNAFGAVFFTLITVAFYHEQYWFDPPCGRRAYDRTRSAR